MTDKRAKAAAAAQFVWRAGSDQTAHAHEYRRGMSFAPRGARTLCGQAIVDIRLAWTPIRRCGACHAIAEGVPMT